MATYQLQYRAKLISKNGDRYPVLDQVTIQVNPESDFAANSSLLVSPIKD